jgi:hypothetical protein
VAKLSEEILSLNMIELGQLLKVLKVRGRREKRKISRGGGSGSGEMGGKGVRACM